MNYQQVVAKSRTLILVGIFVLFLLTSHIAPILAEDHNKPNASLVGSKVEQLREAHRFFDDKNYVAARKSIEQFVAKNPLDYNGYYLLGLTDTKEHNVLPEYDQFAYDQFLKALYLEPQNSECQSICDYVDNLVRGQLRSDSRCVAIPTFRDNSPQCLLNTGLNCFLRGDDNNARDLFDFVIKFCPTAAASAHYNLAAMAERKGLLPQALKEYQVALAVCEDRDRLFAAGTVKRNDVDLLSRNLLLRTIQLVEYKIKTKNKNWMGVDQDKEARQSMRMTINRLSPTDPMTDIRDAGERRNQ
ncbi:MAG: hypothetical protein P4L53_13220 [Candidatus Obscuribacterales bacterium]|nr:hypothetical protein [Candidatus Obscuribacterales bacterium]